MLRNFHNEWGHYESGYELEQRLLNYTMKFSQSLIVTAKLDKDELCGLRNFRSHYSDYEISSSFFFFFASNSIFIHL